MAENTQEFFEIRSTFGLPGPGIRDPHFFKQAPQIFPESGLKKFLEKEHGIKGVGEEGMKKMTHAIFKIIMTPEEKERFFRALEFMDQLRKIEDEKEREKKANQIFKEELLTVLKDAQFQGVLAQSLFVEGSTVIHKRVKIKGDQIIHEEAAETWVGRGNYHFTVDLDFFMRHPAIYASDFPVMVNLEAMPEKYFEIKAKISKQDFQRLIRENPDLFDRGRLSFSTVWNLDRVIKRRLSK